MKIEPFGTAARFEADLGGLVTAVGLDGQCTVMATMADDPEFALCLATNLNRMIGEKRKWSRIWDHLRFLEPGESADARMRVDVVGRARPEIDPRPFAVLVGRPSQRTVIEILIACSIFHLLLHSGSPSCGRVTLGVISIENATQWLAFPPSGMKNDTKTRSSSSAIRRHVKSKRGAA